MTPLPSTFYATVILDPSSLTLDALDDIIEVLTERGYPVYDPKTKQVVAEYLILPLDSPADALKLADEYLLSQCSYEARQVALMAIEIQTLVHEVELQLSSYGCDHVRWSRDRPS